MVVLWVWNWCMGMVQEHTEDGSAPRHAASIDAARRAERANSAEVRKCKNSSAIQQPLGIKPPRCQVGALVKVP